MTKKKARVDQLPNPTKPPTEVKPVPAKPQTVKVQESESKTVAGKVNLDVPVFIFEGYARKRVDVTFSGKGAAGWKAVLMGLEQREARLANGKFVSSVSDAIRWVGEAVQSEL